MKRRPHITSTSCRAILPLNPVGCNDPAAPESAARPSGSGGLAAGVHPCLSPVLTLAVGPDEHHRRTATSAATLPPRRTSQAEKAGEQRRPESAAEAQTAVHRSDDELQCVACVLVAGVDEMAGELDADLQSCCCLGWRRRGWGRSGEGERDLMGAGGGVLPSYSSPAAARDSRRRCWVRGEEVKRNGDRGET